MQRIATCLMFAGEQAGRAEEAAALYASLLDDGEVLGVERFGTPGALFVDVDDAAELDAIYAGLVEGGTVLMPLGPYPFSPRFAWLNDRFGVSWQLRLVA